MISVTASAGMEWICSSRHVERAYTPAELSQWLTDAGFAQVERFANLRLEAPEVDELRIFFAAKKG